MLWARGPARVPTLISGTIDIGMTRQNRRILRGIFAVVGLFAALLGVGTLALIVVFHPPGDLSGAIGGGVVYLAIAAACFFAVWRLKPPASEIAPGFPVIP